MIVLTVDLPSVRSMAVGSVVAGPAARRPPRPRPRRRSRPGGSRRGGRRPPGDATRRRTSAINATTSSAEPPSSAWMKLACLGDTSAVPDPQALGAGGVDQPAGRVARRVGEHRPGVVAPGLVARRQRTISAMLGLAGGGVARRQGERRPTTTTGAAPRSSGGSRAPRSAAGTSRILARRQVDDADAGAGWRPCRSRGRRRSSARRRRSSRARPRPTRSR